MKNERMIIISLFYYFVYNSKIFSEITSPFMFCILEQNQQTDTTEGGRRVSEQGLLKQKRFSDSKNHPVICLTDSDIGLTFKLDEKQPTANPASFSIRNNAFEIEPRSVGVSFASSCQSNDYSSQINLQQSGSVQPERAAAPNSIADVIKLHAKRNKMATSGKRSKDANDLVEKSLMCLTLSNPLRKACIKIVDWK